jgi:hypothetical protein
LQREERGKGVRRGREGGREREGERGREREYPAKLVNLQVHGYLCCILSSH